MSFQTPITIEKAIRNIQQNVYLLPAIQREFVWSAGQIARLFDSIMRDYPINSFLLWQIENENKYRFKFYNFLQEYRQRYATHNPPASIEGLSNIQAILDGQQRLTSLYIGLTGTYAYKRRRVWWADNEYVLPPRRLFLNISREADDQDMEYDFSWRIEKDSPLAQDTHCYKAKDGELWFLTGRILDFTAREDLDEFFDEHDLGPDEKFARRTLRRLWDAVHQKPLINYYLEESQDIDKVVDIFIRTNAGGTHLSFSDLLLSMATAGWKKFNARKEIHKLVDEINGHGYSFSKDFILKSLLVLFSPNIRFKIDNFNAENIERFEDNWEKTRQAIVATVETIKLLGFTHRTLRSSNALIPVIHYIFQLNDPSKFPTAVAYEQDRKRIARYLHAVLLTRLFGRQPDSVLTAIREVITENREIGRFPLEEIVKKCQQIGRSITFTEELARGLLRTRKDDPYAFSILSLLYPMLDYNGVNYHKDHIHPLSCFNKETLDSLNIIDPDKRSFFLNPEHYDSILNLQLLSEGRNTQKRDKSLKEWVETYHPDLDALLIPSGVSLNFADFQTFIEAREEMLLERLRGMWH